MTERQIQPDFLDLPPRSAKPRVAGLTHMLDAGLPEAQFASVLAIAEQHLDIVKLGWGTAYVTPPEVLSAKVARCRAADIRISPGGTLFELAVSQDRTTQFARWCATAGFDTIEISDGTVDLGRARRRKLIKELAGDFHVVCEVGCKDVGVAVDPARWTEAMLDDLDAGAGHVIAEGRESGTVGVYDSAGNPREALVDALLAEVPVGKLIFEAPVKAQQAWFIERVGAQVNLGNIAPGDLIGVETLRRGLRADTVTLAVSTWTNAWVARTLLDYPG